MYGTKICEVHGVEYYGFPELSALAACEESDLRKAGFGYRAKFIHQSAKQIQDFGGVEWLEGLKKCSYAEAKSELIKLSGIGAKVVTNSSTPMKYFYFSSYLDITLSLHTFIKIYF